MKKRTLNYAVLEMLAHGLQQKEIAEKLGVSHSLISIDIKQIRAKSKKDLESHFQEQLPYEYARSMAGINATLRRVAELLEEAKDPKTKIECMKLQMELWKSVMSMATDGGILQRAITVIEGMESNSKTKTKSESESIKSEIDAIVSNDEKEIAVETEAEPEEESSKE